MTQDLKHMIYDAKEYDSHAPRFPMPEESYLIRVVKDVERASIAFTLILAAGIAIGVAISTVVWK